MELKQDKALQKMITNQAEVTYTYNDGQNTVTEETCPTQTCVESGVDMKLYKTACPETLGCTDKLCYVLTAVNYKSSAVNGVRIEDTLPPGVTYNNDAMVTYEGGAPMPITAEALAPLTFTLPHLPAESAAVIQFTVDLSGIAPGTYLTNTAILTYDGYVGAVISAAITQQFSCAHLTATKEGPDSVVCGEPFDYTIYLHNTGDQSAMVTALSDQFNDCLIVDRAGITVVGHAGTPIINLTADNILTISGFAVPAGETVVVTIPVTLRCDCYE